MNHEWTLVGKVLKTKGFTGSMIVDFQFPVKDASFKAFFILKNGVYTPLLIKECSQVDEFTCTICWNNYLTKELAQTLNNTELYIAESLFLKHFSDEVDEDYIGFEVYNGEVLLGEVVDILENKFQETLEVLDAEDKKLLIPFIDEFVETIDEEKGIIYVHLEDDYIKMFSC